MATIYMAGEAGRSVRGPGLKAFRGEAERGGETLSLSGISDLIHSGAISPHVSASDRRQVLSVAAEIAARTMGVRAPCVFDALLARETLGSTGLGHGVATPHAKVKGLTRLGGVFMRLERPIEFQAVDDQPVDLIFVLLAPPRAGSEHLRALARVARLLRQAEWRTRLRRARNKEEIRSILAQEATPSAA